MELVEPEERPALGGLGVEALWRSGGAYLGASDGLDGAAQLRSSGLGLCVFDEVALRRNGGVVHDAFGEPDGEAHWRSGEAAFGASGGLGAEAL